MRRDGNGGAARDVLALTEQERRVLALVTEGQTNKQIAAALGLSEKTIKNYLSHAFEKLNVTRRAQAAVRFMSHVRYLGASVAPWPVPDAGRPGSGAAARPTPSRDAGTAGPEAEREQKSA